MPIDKTDGIFYLLAMWQSWVKEATHFRRNGQGYCICLMENPLSIKVASRELFWLLQMFDCL